MQFQKNKGCPKNPNNDRFLGQPIRAAIKLR